MSDDLHITVVDYVSGLGVPGIMPPKLRTTEISGTPAGAKFTQKLFNGQPVESDTKSGELAGDSLTTVFALVDELQQLPTPEQPGLGDVFGENKVVLVRKGRNVLWGYNPSAGCGAGPDSEGGAPVFALTTDHMSKFKRIVNGILQATSDSF
ncbi:hypothetical protein EC988_003982 [Linderina pennispora]|nr:hypothetical protein EC988_003982 [Linderina pennispora]